jgi:hypothetical protein
MQPCVLQTASRAGCLYQRVKGITGQWGRSGGLIKGSSDGQSKQCQSFRGKQPLIGFVHLFFLFICFVFFFNTAVMLKRFYLTRLTCRQLLMDCLLPLLAKLPHWLTVPSLFAVCFHGFSMAPSSLMQLFQGAFLKMLAPQGIAWPKDSWITKAWK